MYFVKPENNRINLATFYLLVVVSFFSSVVVLKTIVVTSHTYYLETKSTFLS